MWRLLLVGTVLLAPHWAMAGPPKVDFAKDVAPLLRERCVECHSGPKAKSGFNLESRKQILEGGYSGQVLLPGDGKGSRIVRVLNGTDDDKVVMPPEGGKPLTDGQVALLARWIDEGAVWPDEIVLKASGGTRAEEHWAFQPIRRPEMPDVRTADWVQNGIDRFVLARLEKEGYVPSREADRQTQIRRLSLDLTGLPPLPEDVRAFVDDEQPDAYERLVDRLLESPHYGEKWARAWLDLCHYADTDGYLTDQLRPVAWRYRQWVVEALNRDLPYDQFTLQQLAGDLLPDATLEQRMGTGFLRNTLSNREGGADLEEYRVEQIVDRVTMVSATWLGLTIGCARCHDHKYDPLNQREFYQFYAFFNLADEINVDAPLPDELEPYLAKLPEYETKRKELLAPLEKQIAELQSRWEMKCLQARDNPGQDHVWDRQWEVLGLVWGGRLGEGQLEGCQIVELEPSKRTDPQKARILDYFLRSGSIVDPKQFADLKIPELVVGLDKLKSELPKVTRAPLMHTSRIPRHTRLHVRGNFREPGIPVEAGVPAVLPPMETAAFELPPLPPPGGYSEGLPAEPARNRLALARWLVDPRNPLTARVAVNRQWQELFGRGIVATSEDFGTQGSPPSHPELLDWLACEFREGGWSLKQLHRLIVTSATYRQSSSAGQAFQLTDTAGIGSNAPVRRQGLTYEKDPSNVLLGRQQSLRLSAEAVRDVTLASSGLFARRIGGPCVFPPQPERVVMEGFGDNTWTESTGADRYRRGLYTFHQRLSPFAQNVTFDAPANGRVCSRRERSNTPLQALTLLNDPVFFEAARSLAGRILREGGSTVDTRVDHAFEVCLSRLPSHTERSRMAAHLEVQRTLLQSDAEVLKTLVPQPLPGTDPLDAAAWTVFASVLLNTHEFISRE